MDLNKAKEEDLQDLGLLSPLQIQSLINYREKLGNLLAIYELQAIPNFDLNTIHRILPYISLKASLDDYQVPIGKMLLQGKNELNLRWSRILENTKGLNEGKYAGDANKYWLRYKHFYANRMSLGLTAEKDAGEAFFSKNNPQGFDFYSAHLSLFNYNSWLKSLVVGDFSANFGQGLILFSDFALGKSSLVTNIKRTSKPIKAYSSINESSFLRGIATTLGLGKQLEWTIFASVRRRDANLAQVDTLSTYFSSTEDLVNFTSLYNSGLHRTESEINAENTIQNNTFGSSLKWKTTNAHLAANILWNQFDKPFLRTLKPYNQFYFNGKSLLNASLDYSYRFQNWHFFGETAVSDNKSIASINGLMLSLDRKTMLALSHRYYPAAFQTLMSNPFAEIAQGNNEQGFYIGLEHLINQQLKFSIYYDNWKHPWLLYQVDAPSFGREYLTRLTYTIRKKMECYAQIRTEIKQKNAPNNESKLNFLVNTTRTQIRLHNEYIASKSWTFRTRIEATFFDNGVGQLSKGFLFYQDIIHHPFSPFSFSARLAYFNTNNYNSRIYAYENDVIYSFSIPAYFDKGLRYYINFRWQMSKQLSLESRLAQSYFFNLNQLGSSWDSIQKNHKTEAKLQLRWAF